MRVLFVTSEVYPLAKSGGLADVSRALPLALQAQGLDVRILMPGYNSALSQLKNPRMEAALPPMLGVEETCLIGGVLPGTDLPVLLIKAPSLYARSGGLYQDETNRDWDDNPRRFAYLARVAALIGTSGLRGWRPDVVHANDWHAGLAPLYLKSGEAAAPPTVLTIHNLAFQGNFPPAALEQTDIPRSLFNSDGVEFYGHLSFLKAGLRYADKITTVSPAYGREILTPEFGCGLEGVLRDRAGDLIGILNGIDDSWNPATDSALTHRFSVRDISGKRACKADLQRVLGLGNSARPLLAFVSRLAHQKMIDILTEAIPDIMETGAQLVVSGDGDSAIEKEMELLQARFPQQMAYRHYDETLAHRIQAGADSVLSPARYEPCGLTHIYALKYGSLPIVRRTGGLADTVTDANAETVTSGTATGFVFDEVSRDGLMQAVSRALGAFDEPLTWRRMQLAAMSQDFGWECSTAKYISVYSEVSGSRAPQLTPLNEIELKQALSA